MNWNNTLSTQKSSLRINASDHYPTPLWCAENIDVDWSQFSTVHEPCKGDGRLYEWLQTLGPDASYSDIDEGLDFFEWDEQVDLIFTSPPTTLAQEFAEHAINHAQTVFMMMRLSFLGSIKRHDWWLKNPPRAMYMLSKRPSFIGGLTDATDFAWFVWDKTDRIPLGIHFTSLPTPEQTARDNAYGLAALKK